MSDAIFDHIVFDKACVLYSLYIYEIDSYYQLICCIKVVE